MTVDTRLEMHGSVLFENNSCNSCNGGAISVTDASEVEIFDSVTFKNNSGLLGGAIIVRASTIVLNPGARMESIDNYAEFSGGGIFHYDNIDYFQCNFTMNANYSKFEVEVNLPDCFLRLKNFTFTNTHQYQILSINDTAGTDGQFLYGGLIDRCHIVDARIIKYELLYNVVFKYGILDIQPFNNQRNVISSKPYTLCLCKSTEIFDCTGIVQILTYRGRRFNVSVLALSQGNAISKVVIQAEVNKTARLKHDQYSRHITANCSTLSYNMYSTQGNERLAIYTNQDCLSYALTPMVVMNITFLPCQIR